MNMPLDDEWEGLGNGLLGPQGKMPVPGLGDSLMQAVQQATPQAPLFPPAIDMDIPGGMGPLSTALAGLGIQPLPDVMTLDGKVDKGGMVPFSASSAAASQPRTQVQNLDLDKAINHLDIYSRLDVNGQPNLKSKHLCASYVRQALAAGGVDLPIINEAKDYGPALLKAGFTQLDGGPRKSYTPQRGDVIIYPPFLPKHPSGHMEMYDGNHWVSDFQQQGPIPFGDGSRPYSIYRP